MKARTKLQKDVVRASKSLSPLTEAQRKQALKQVPPHIAKFRASRTQSQAKGLGYAEAQPKLPEGNWGKRGQYVCLDCSHSWSGDKAEQVVCPHCGAMLTTDDSRKRVFKHKTYFQTITTCQGFQVLRVWYMSATYREGMPMTYWINEAFQRWIAPHGTSVVISRARHIFGGYYIDNWNWQSDLELRTENTAHGVSPYDIIGRSNYIPQLKRNGFTGDCHDLSPQGLFTALLSNPKIETLLKCGQISLLQHFVKSTYGLDRHWQSIKIAIRHNYKVTDASLWLDMLSAMAECGKDVHNPSVICVADLPTAHDYWVARKQTKWQREREAADRERARQNERKYMQDQKQVAKDEAEFVAAKSRFFDIKIEDGSLTITPLQSVAEYFDESRTLHHCVASNRYFAKEQTLVLHAVVDGEPVETIEIDLNTLQIVQCRGKYNGISEHHTRIVELMKANIGEIAKRKAA